MVASGQFAFWKRFDTSVCYKFYGECLTKYSHRAASESEDCQKTRHSHINEAESDFNHTIKGLLETIKDIQSNIACGSISNETHRQECFNNIVSYSNNVFF